MHDTRLALLLFGACWLAFSVTATALGEAAPQWSLVRRAGDIEIDRRAVSGADLPALRGSAHFPAPVSEVLRAISDYDHFTGFIPNVSESRVLDQADAATWVYQRLAFPAPIADRHYIIKVVNDRHAASPGVIDVSWQLDRARSMALANTDALLPDAFSGSWHLEAPAGRSGCDAVYTIHVDPAGVLPNWLFVRVAERYVVEVMNAVHNRVAVTDR